MILLWNLCPMLSCLFVIPICIVYLLLWGITVDCFGLLIFYNRWLIDQVLLCGYEYLTVPQFYPFSRLSGYPCCNIISRLSAYTCFYPFLGNLLFPCSTLFSRLTAISLFYPLFYAICFTSLTPSLLDYMRFPSYALF